MAEVTRRRIGELVQGVLKILRDKPEGMRARDVVAQLETTVPPTEFERVPYESRPDARRANSTPFPGRIRGRGSEAASG